MSVCFFVNFLSFKPDTEHNVTMYQANSATLMPFSKE